ncbi:MAG: metal ABC transporter ATP-binding protein [Anaerolineae bacterium]
MVMPTVKTVPHPTVTPALSVRGLAAGYPGDRRAVRDVSFDVLPGERVAVIGPNGAGKSTLFKAMVGLIPFTEGQMSIHGEDCRTSHTMVGYVPQHEAIDWSFPATVYDVVMMGRTRKSGWLPFTSARDKQMVYDLLERLSLSHLAQRQIGQLSGGQKRRVFIARALALETSVLLLDEPFNGVDAAAEAEIMETLDVLAAQDITVILATHDLSKAATQFDKLMVLRHTLVAYGEPEDIMTPEVLQTAYGGGLRIFNHDNAMLVIADEHGCGD